jgi:hypothetical protein
MSDEIDLTPAERELETALRSLRPITARLDSTVAARTARQRVAPLGRRYWQMAAAAILMAVAGTWLGWGGGRTDRAPHSSTDIAIASETSAARLTVNNYRRALAQSVGELEALLDRQAADAERGKLGRSDKLTVWNSDYRSLLGEM